MNDILSLEKPTLLLDEARARRNIARMVAKAKASGVHFRPHFKTHQSAEIGDWFRDEGVEAITVSSVEMAYGFARHGWRDITIAFPVNLRQMAALNDLAERVTLGLVVEAAETAARLDEGLRHPAQVWLKVDSGYGRTGIPWQAREQFATMARAVRDARRLSLAGLLTHAGHSYRARSLAEAATVFRGVAERMQQAREAVPAEGAEPAISVGDTPGCSAVERFEGVDEVRPGNFVFYDLTQAQIGVCATGDIAVAVVCPVVAKHPERGTLILHGGAVHLSKDYLTAGQGRPSFGRIATLGDQGWTEPVAGAAVVSLSQEHGVVEAQPDFLERVAVGDLLAVLPVHSCLTVDLMPYYVTLDGRQIGKVATK